MPPPATGWPRFYTRGDLDRLPRRDLDDLALRVYGAVSSMDDAALRRSLLAAQAELIAGDPRWSATAVRAALPPDGWWPANYARFYDEGNRRRPPRAAKVPVRPPPANPTSSSAVAIAPRVRALRVPAPTGNASPAPAPPPPRVRKLRVPVAPPPPRVKKLRGGSAPLFAPPAAG